MVEFESTAAVVVQSRPQQPQHYPPLARTVAHSIIDNALAQACNRKRRHSSPSLSKNNNRNFTDDDAALSSPSSLKMSKIGDFTIMDRLLRTSSSSLAAPPHGNGNVVVIVSDGFAASSSSLKDWSSSSSHSQSSLSSSSSSHAFRSSFQDISPDTLIKSILLNQSCGHSSSSDRVDCDEENDAQEVCGGGGPRRLLPQPLHETDFLHPTEEQIAAYNTHIIAAVRASDISTLRTMHNNGQTLGCCNRYGESILHMACRRSNAHIVSFLLKEANVSPRIKDDHGRTPLHDACWRGTPEYSIVKLLLSVEPRLAFAKDVWGHTPFQYARKEHWGAWNDFLDQNRDLILS